MEGLKFCTGYYELSLIEGIFGDAKGVHCESLDIMHAKNVFVTLFWKICSHINTNRFRNLLGITFEKTKCYMSSKLIQIFHESNSKLFLRL